MNLNEQPNKRTKIVATLGPASDDEKVIALLLENGVDVVRMNFSHGDHSWHRKTIQTIRRAAETCSKPVAIMQDLQGPRLRTGRLEEGGGVELRNGSLLSIAPGDFAGTAACLATDYSGLAHDVNVGGRILLSDGLIELKVVEISNDEVRCRVLSGGRLRPNQGINLPGAELSIAPPTEKDREDLRLGLECGVDYVALSFVSRAEEMKDLREEINRNNVGRPPATVAKIERPQAVDNIGPILREADAVMIARGDLGIEMAPEEVPHIQKHIIQSANKAARPVITATQMLESMIRNPRPTRAETSDVANAILDGSDAVMLSGETAIGDHPVRTVKMMHRIAVRTEPFLPPSAHGVEKGADPAPPHRHTRALAAAACRVAVETDARALVAFTMTGATARYLAQRRAALPIYALTPSGTTLRKLAMVWGVTPLRFPLLESTDDMISMGREKMLQNGLAAPGDTMVCVAGPSTRTPGGANMLELLRL